jgi:hypothetical protein
MTAGPWRPVSIEIAAASIQDITIKYDIRPDLSAISGTVRVEFEGQADGIRLRIAVKDSVVFTETTVSQDSSTISFALCWSTFWVCIEANIEQQRLACGILQDMETRISMT